MGVQQVAAAAGVSVGTVSNVLNRPWVVSTPTRERVRRVIAEQGWVPHAPARRLRSGTVRSVAVVVDDLVAQRRVDVLRGVADRLESNRRQLLLFHAGGEPDRFVSHVTELAGEGVGSVVLCVSPPLLDAAMVGRLAAVTRTLDKLGIGVGLVDASRPVDAGHLTGLGASCVGVTTTRADCVDAALAHLLGLGHTAAVVVGADAVAVTGQLRSVARAAGLRLYLDRSGAGKALRASAVVVLDEPGLDRLAAIRRAADHPVDAVGVGPLSPGRGDLLAVADVDGYEAGRTVVDLMSAGVPQVADPASAVFHLRPHLRPVLGA